MSRTAAFTSIVLATLLLVLACTTIHVTVQSPEAETSTEEGSTEGVLPIVNRLGG